MRTYPCRYGLGCTSKNPAHYHHYTHPEALLQEAVEEEEEEVEADDKEEGEDGGTKQGAAVASAQPEGGAKKVVTRKAEDFLHVIAEPGRMAEKLEKAAPYNIFFTAVTDSKATHNKPGTVTFQELLDPSLGSIESSLYITCVLDLTWLIVHRIIAGLKGKPMTIVCGVKEKANVSVAARHPYITLDYSRVVPYASSNAQLMVHKYADGSMRLMIPSANLYEEDWDNRTQSVWISPRLPPLPANGGGNLTGGESPTKFRAELIRFLRGYKMANLEPWIEQLKCVDFSEIKVFLVACVPGFSKECPEGYHYGHARLGHLLRRHASTHIPSTATVVAQCSVLGFLDGDVRGWWQSNFLNSLRKDMRPLAPLEFPPFKIIFPSLQCVLDSHDGMIGSTFVLYSRDREVRQPWVRQHLHRWRSDERERTKSLPHTKTYARIDEQQRKVYWAVYTSANIAKNGWGSIEYDEENDEPLLLSVNYELGVLFLPNILIGEDAFPLDADSDAAAFPLPYDVPLTPYAEDERALFTEDIIEFLTKSQESSNEGDDEPANADEGHAQ